ncbi:hypothetical protein ACOME3_006874 [Neoechinorhynchus agilis]
MSEETASETSRSHSDQRKGRRKSEDGQIVSETGFDPLSKLVIYSLNPKNRFILKLYCPRLIQKSYGNEKRFLCPPPCIKFVGPRWSNSQLQKFVEKSRDGKMLADDLILHVNLKGEAPVTLSLKNEISMLISGLFTTDLERSKKSNLEISIHQFGGYQMARILSSGINVVTKPSRRQLIRFPRYMGSYRTSKSNHRTFNNDPPDDDNNEVSTLFNSLCLMSGMQVCIFCRSRAHALHTLFLHTNKTGWNEDSIIGVTDNSIEDPALTCSATQWTPFQIFKKDPDYPESKIDETEYGTICEDVVVPGPITVGSSVIIRNESTGICSPSMIVEKVGTDAQCEDVKILEEKGLNIVCQLHKYALRLEQADHPSNLFLTAHNNGELQFEEPNGLDRSVNSNKNFGMAFLQTWSFVTVEEISFSWAIDNTFAGIVNNIVPRVISVCTLSICEGEHLVEVIGVHLLPIHIVYFGSLAAVTTYRTSRQLLAIAPIKELHFGNRSCTVSNSDQNNRLYRFEKGRLIVPVSIARPDGVAFPTDIDFVYEL